MFDRLFRRAERKIDSVVSKYVRRALAAVPLLIAAIFATAALTSKLVEVYGSVYGYAIMAGGFAGLSGIIALFALTGASTPVEEAEAAAAENHDDLKEADDRPLVSPELLSVLTTAAPMALPGVARAAARNLPVLVLFAIVAYLFVRYAGRSAGEPGEAAAEGTDAAGDDDAAADLARAEAASARAEGAAATSNARAAAA